MNKAILMGRLTKDVETRYTQAENPMAISRYTLAVNRQKKDEADFINCVAFGSNAEFADKYLKKGTKILVEGRIQTGNYTNKDGVKIYTTDIVVERQEFAESKGSTGTTEPADNDFMNIPDGIEELPFA